MEQHDHAVVTDEHAGHSGHGAGHGAGHDKHAGHGDGSMFRDKFWVSLVLAVPVVGFSEMFADLVGYEVPGWAGWIPPVVGTFLFFYGGWPFLAGAKAELADRLPGMMTLIALAI